MSDETTPAAGQRPKNFSQQPRGKPCVLNGKVVGTKMAKTLVVEVGRTVMDPKYKKYIRTHHKVYAHDEKGDGQLGDEVRVEECRPYSKLKRYRLAKVIKRAGASS